MYWSHEKEEEKAIMKLIMEGWRSFLIEEEIPEIPGDEMEALIIQAIEGLGLSKTLEEDIQDKIFRGLVGGGFAAMIPLILFSFAEQAEDSARFRQGAVQAAQDLASTATKIDELEKQLNENPAPWQWSDDMLANPRTGDLYRDPTSLEAFPTIDFDNDKKPDASVLAPSWSIAMEVLKDKQAGTVRVPGYAEGEVPPLKVITNALKNVPPTSGTNAATFIKDFRHAMMYTGQLGAKSGKGIQQLDNVNIAVSDAGEINVARDTVSVNPEAFKEMPRYKLPDSGQTAQDTYIKFFFGRYLGAEEALKYGVEAPKRKVYGFNK